MKRKHKRLTFVVIAGLFIALAVGLMLSAFEENIVFFRTPGDVASGSIEEDRRIRLGGLVEEGSVVPGADGLVNFSITDTVDTVKVTYVGILPDLFREGQGVVMEGRLQADGSFRADEVLAKHDENYMPKEVADSLKKAGMWKGTEKK